MNIIFLVFVCSLMNSFICGYNKAQVKALLKAIAQNSTSINATGCDFRGAGTLLSGIQVPGGIFNGVNFSMYDFSNDTYAQNIKSNLAGCIIIPHVATDLTGANFSNCSLINANFQGAILNNANFTGANIDSANFSQAVLTGAIFDKVKGQSTANFCNATMPDSSTCSGQNNWKNSQDTVTLSCNCSQASSSGNS